MLTNENLEEFLATARRNKWCLPPLKDLRHAHHYWVRDNPQATGSADMGQYTVMQWSPTKLSWYRSNGLATCAEGDGTHLENYECVMRVFLPPLSPAGILVSEVVSDYLDRNIVDHDVHSILEKLIKKFKAYQG